MVHDAITAPTGKAANVTDLEKRSQILNLLKIYCLQVLVWLKHHKDIVNMLLIPISHNQNPNTANTVILEWVIH